MGSGIGDPFGPRCYKGKAVLFCLGEIFVFVASHIRPTPENANFGSLLQG